MRRDVLDPRQFYAGALGGEFGPWWDKIPGKFEGWDQPRFEAAEAAAAEIAMALAGSARAA